MSPGVFQESRSLAGLASHASLAGLASHASFAGLATHASLALGVAASAFTFSAQNKVTCMCGTGIGRRGTGAGGPRAVVWRRPPGFRDIYYIGNGGPGAETPDCSLVGFEANRKA